MIYALLPKISLMYIGIYSIYIYINGPWNYVGAPTISGSILDITPPNLQTIGEIAISCQHQINKIVMNSLSLYISIYIYTYIIVMGAKAYQGYESGGFSSGWAFGISQVIPWRIWPRRAGGPQFQFQFQPKGTFKMRVEHGSLNVPIEHHPTIRYMVYNGYYNIQGLVNVP